MEEKRPKRRKRTHLSLNQSRQKNRKTINLHNMPSAELEQDVDTTLLVENSANVTPRIPDITHKPDARFDPQSMNEALNFKKRLQRGQTDRLSFGHLLEGESPVLRQDMMSNAMKRRSANLNLQRSIQLLDDAVATPGSAGFRPGSKTPQLLRHSNYTPSRLQTRSQFDVSASLGIGASSNSLMNTPGSAMATFGESAMDSISTMPSTPGRSILPDYSTIPEEDIATSNVAVLLQEDPGINACGSMFHDFMSSFRANQSEHQIFQLIEEYERICDDNVSLLKKLMKKAVPGQRKFNKTLEMYEILSDEKKTWRLIASLYHDRIESETKQQESMMMDTLGQYQSEKDIIQGLYDRDAMIRQTQLVIDWLEKNAGEDLEDCYDKLDFFTDQTGAWENTLHSLKQKQGSASNTFISTDRQVVNSLDPDAPIREKKPLADLDMEDESRLLKYMFACIRAGQLEEAQKICQKVGQSWRGATLEGWRLFHDPNHSKETRSEAVEGNQYRDVWKSVCWRLSEEEKLHVYERAMYAAYSGNLQHLLPACETWEDYLWAYCRVMVDNQVEQEIQLNHILHRARQQLPQQYSEKVLKLDNIFDEIQASPREILKIQSKEKFHIIQKYIILRAEDSLIEEMYEWTRDDLNRLPEHLLRFMTHLVLFFRTIGIDSKEDQCISILETYVRYLTEEKQIPLIACYVATLPQQNQLDSYARFLEGISDNDERQQCLLLAAEFELDVHTITKLVVENIRSRESPDFHADGDLPRDAVTTVGDRMKIDAIDWLVFDPQQRPEALKQTNAIMRTFLATRKLSAAREVFQKIPPGSIDTIYKMWQIKTGSTELDAEESNAIREYLCVQAYLDAHDSFNDWFQHFHNAQPTKPEIPAGANFTERVAFEHKEKQYEAELERWKHSLLLQTKTTKEKIYNVLVFVDGGWMVDQHEDSSGDKQRLHQMKLLRQLCLPTLCFLLYQVLHGTEQHKECIQMADLIASEQYRLYMVFRKDELQRLLGMLRETSISLLDQNLDPLGYQLS